MLACTWQREQTSGRATSWQRAAPTESFAQGKKGGTLATRPRVVHADAVLDRKTGTMVDRSELKMRARFRDKFNQRRKVEGDKGPAWMLELWAGSWGGTVEYEIDGKTEHVEIDPELGPCEFEEDGGMQWAFEDDEKKHIVWHGLPAAEQKARAYHAARRNHAFREGLHDSEWHPGFLAKKAAKEAAEAAAQQEQIRAWMEAQAQELDRWKRLTPKEQREQRCWKEIHKPPIFWTPIGLDTVDQNHEKIRPGMIYGLEFPWNEALLVSPRFGPQWLTTAFHTVGTLAKDNSVLEIILENKVKITAGNNAGKFLFEVKYARQDPGLDTQFFVKCPFAMTPETKSDRHSSSVYKQPMDLHEISTYRLLEAFLPMETPKFYFGDISNETSNFVLITARIPFAEINGIGKRKLKPFEIEGPYDKCMDYLQMRGNDKEYYTLIQKVTGRISGRHKAGKYGSEEFLRSILAAPASRPEHMGVDPNQATGGDPRATKSKLETAYKFITTTAGALYPKWAATPAFKYKWMNTLMTYCAYQQEIEWWKVSKSDYVALGHQNLNADNAYFWRDDEGKLDCGVFDWGGFGQSCIGHKIWWTFNCANWPQVKENLDDYLQTFIHEYHEYGGPLVDMETLKMQVFMTCLGNIMFMNAAVPNCFTMCSKKQWETITEWDDPRIAENINGKSTLKTTLHVLYNGIQMLHEKGADKMLDKWVKEIWTGTEGQKAKSTDVIWGGLAPPVEES